jgi:hypothetical protein
VATAQNSSTTTGTGTHIVPSLERLPVNTFAAYFTGWTARKRRGALGRIARNFLAIHWIVIRNLILVVLLLVCLVLHRVASSRHLYRSGYWECPRCSLRRTCKRVFENLIWLILAVRCKSLSDAEAVA